MKRLPDKINSDLLPTVRPWLGKIENTKIYWASIEFSQGAEVYYFASHYKCLRELENAEGKVRSAIALNKNYDAAYELLLLFYLRKKIWWSNKYMWYTHWKRDAQSLYMKALSLENKQVDLAYDAFMGLEITKDNEVWEVRLKILEKFCSWSQTSNVGQVSYGKRIEKAQRFISNVALYNLRL